MMHNLKVSVGKNAKTSGLVSLKKISIREKILRLLLGEKTKVTVLVPGESIKELEITNVK